MTSCDYFGDYCFEIQNKTNQIVTISYYEQLQSTEDILPTYNHGEDYEYIHLDSNPTLITLQPDSTFERTYEIGRVNKYWPTEDDTPERYHIVSIWDRIDYIAVGSDTLNVENYSKDKWSCKNGWKFTLTLK
jgi:hypothetical protein